MAKSRKLKEGEYPSIGDVLEFFAGPFGTAVVVRVHDDGSVDCQRPTMLVTGGAPSPALQVESIERISSSAIRGYQFWTQRDVIQNTWYEEQARLARAEERAKALAALEATLKAS